MPRARPALIPTFGVVLWVASCGQGPRVVSIYPADGVQGVALDARVEVAYDRPVRFVTQTAPVVLTLDGEEVASVVSIGEGGGPVILTPRYFLLTDRTYQIHIRQGVEDFQDHGFTSPRTSTFTTVQGCDIHPAAGATLPAGPDGAGGVIIPGGRRISPPGIQLKLGSFPTNLALSRDGQLLVATNNGRGVQNKEQSLMLVHTSGQDSPRVAQTLSRPPPQALFYGLAFNKDGDRLYASGGGSDRVEIFQVTADKFLEKIGEFSVEGFPAGLCLDEGRGLLYVAAQENSEVVALDSATGEQRFKTRVGTLPYDLELGPRREKLYVSLWGRASLFEPGRVVILEADSGARLQHIDVGKNPEDLLLAPDGRLLVACSDADRVDVIDTSTDSLTASWNLRRAPSDPVGLSPVALALDPGRGRLYVACAQKNAVDVLALADGSLLGSLPTAWYPTAVAVSPNGETLYVANGRGTGTGPNASGSAIESLLVGTLSVMPVPARDELPGHSATVEDNNKHALRYFPDRCLGKAFPLPRAVGEPSPIRHVIFVLRENKTYDQNLGDLEGADGDPSLTMFGERVTPNLHALAREFCNLDNFHAEVEVSVTGHYWNVASSLNDFAEKAWHANYRDDSRLASVGAHQVDYPPGLFLWHRLEESSIDFRNYGEPYGIVGEYDRFAEHIHTDYMLDLGLNLYSTPDSQRVAWFLEEVQAGIFPPFVFLLLPNDHTYGLRPGRPTPQWMVAENDHATGLLVDQISHSEFWPETLIIVTEDDPQSGMDHVDSHRSIALLISPYTRRGYTSSVHHGFSSLIRTYGLILGMPALNLLDQTASPVYECFTAVPDFSPYDVREQVVEYALNPSGTLGARESELMDFTVPDRARGLGKVLWMATHPGEPIPEALMEQDDEDEETEERWRLPVPLGDNPFQEVLR